MNRVGHRLQSDFEDYTIEVFIDLDEDDPEWDAARGDALSTTEDQNVEVWREWDELATTQTDIFWPPEKTREVTEAQLDALLRSPKWETREFPDWLLDRLLAHRNKGA